MNNKQSEIWAGLATPWWRLSAKRNPVRGALALAFAERFAPAIFEALTKNERESRKPATLTDLATILGFSRGHMGRIVGGQHTFKAYDIIVLAHSIHERVGNLLPDLSCLLPRATKRLVGNAVTDAEAAVYAAYRLTIPEAKRLELDEQGLNVACRAQGITSVESARGMITKVAQEVGKRIGTLDSAP